MQNTLGFLGALKSAKGFYLILSPDLRVTPAGSGQGQVMGAWGEGPIGPIERYDTETVPHFRQVPQPGKCG